MVAAVAGTIVTGVDGIETTLVVPELAEIDIIVVDGFGNSCLVEEALLLSWEDLALLLVFDWGVPGNIGEAFPESRFEDVVGNETIIASSSSSWASSLNPSE